MSLVQEFPEIDKFFKQDKFTQDDLNELVEYLESKYTTLQERKASNTLIELEMLKFSLQGISKIDDTIKHNKRVYEIEESLCGTW